jgi:TP901 family phage tail tape measure protein
MAGAFDLGAAKAKILFDDSQYQKGIKRVKGQNAEASKSFNAVGVAAAAGAALIVAGLISSIKKANEFQKAFANVRTLVDETKVNTKAMQKELLNLDARLGSSLDLTKGLYQALSAGVEPARAVMFVGEAAKFAKAALTDTFAAVDVLTTVLNAYELEAIEATRVSDVLFQTIKLGKITGQELASSLGSVIPTASTLGIEIEDLGAAIAVMTKQGVDSFKTVTQLQALFNAFIKPSTAMVEKFKELGIESGSVLAKTEGLAGILKFLQDATDGNIEKMGELLPNVRALKGALSLTGKQADNFAETLIQMQDAAGSTQEAFEKQELTFETLGNKVEKLQIKIGNAFLPVLFQLSQALGAIVKAGQIVAPILQIILDAIGSFVKTIGTGFGEILTEISTAFGELTSDLKLNVSIFDILAIILKVVNINFVVGLKIIRNMIKLLINLVMIGKDTIDVFVTLGKAIFQPKKWKEVGQTVKDLGGSIKKLAVDAIADWADIGITIAKEFEKLDDGAKIQAGKWEDIWNDAINDMKGNFDDLGKKTDDTGKKIEKELTPKEKLRLKWIQFQKDFLSGWEETGSKVLEVVNFFLGQIKDAVGSISSIIQMFFQNDLEALVAANEEKIIELEEQKELELLSLQDQRDRGAITEEEFAEKKAAIEKKMDDKILKQKEENKAKENAAKEKAFKANQANQIAQAWINFAIGTIAAWVGAVQALAWIPVVGPGLAIAMGAVMTGLLLGTTIAQTVAISQQKFIPERARGGRISGTAIMNEEGPEAVHLPDGSIVVPADITAAAIGAAGGMQGSTQINISFAGAKIADDMSLRKVTEYVRKELSKELRVARG